MATFICENCGSKHKKWVGKCPDCFEWNCLAEDVSFKTNTKGATEFTPFGYITKENNIPDVEFSNLLRVTNIVNRIQSGFSELDTVLGGGFVSGSAILIGGEPGIGKSTLLLCIAGKMAQSGKKVLYVSGEESVTQISIRGERLGLMNEETIKNITIASSGLISSVLKKIMSEKIDFMIIDSIQTTHTIAVESSAGTVAQIRATTVELISFCKERDITLIIVGHVTKDGAIAGPKLLEHMVDVVIYFEGDSHSQFRLLRSIKNRFGSTNEIGVFQMSDSGLIDVPNPSSLFLSSSKQTGEIIFVSMEGNRAMLVAVESLISRSYFPSPKRSVVGWDYNRFAMILAIMQTYCNMQFQDKDIYLNMVGGFRTNETANDLAVIMSLLLTTRKLVFKKNTIVFGEVSLSGEVKNVSRIMSRLKEAKKVGCENFIVPSSADIGNFECQEIIRISHIKELDTILKNLTIPIII